MPPAPAAPEPARIGAFGRIFGVLYSPGETFADIARKPSWLAAMAVLIVFSLAFCWMMNQRIDWAEYIRGQAEKSPRFAQLSEEQKRQALEPQIKFTPPIVYVVGILIPPIAALVWGVVGMVGLNSMSGSGVKFAQAFGIATHAQCMSLVSAPLGILTMWMRSYGDVTPENMLASNLGAFMSSDSPAWLRALGGALDIFEFWFLALLAVGFSAVNKKKASTGKAMGIIFGAYAIWVLLKTGWAAAFGG
jgi:hypothetical protein